MEAAWRNAECVTSLYDHIRDIELRNAALEAEVLKLQEQGAATRTTDVTNSVDIGRALRERDEWRDRYQQVDDANRRLEKKLASIANEHAEQIAKWQERCVFNPHEPKRVALCLASLQKTLDARLEENEAMAQRLHSAHVQVKALSTDNADLRDRLNDHARYVEHHRRHLMRTLVARYCREHVHSTWHRWCRRTLLHRMDAELHARTETVSAVAVLERSKHITRLAAQLQSRLARKTKQRHLSAWYYQATTLTKTRKAAEGRARAAAAKLLAAAFHRWQVLHRRYKALRRLVCQQERHRVRHALVKWRLFRHLMADVAKECTMHDLRVACAEREQKLADALAALAQCSTHSSLLQERLSALMLATQSSQKASATLRSSSAARLAAQCWLRLAHRTLRDVWHAWVGFAGVRRSLRARQQLWLRRQAQWRLHLWAARARTRSYCETLWWHLRARRGQRHTRQCFEALKQRAILARHRRQRVALLQARHALHFGLRLSWATWRRYAAVRASRPSALLRVCLGRAVAATRQAFDHWHSHAAAIERRDKKLVQVLAAMLRLQDNLRQRNACARWVAHLAHKWQLVTDAHNAAVAVLLDESASLQVEIAAWRAKVDAKDSTVASLLQAKEKAVHVGRRWEAVCKQRDASVEALEAQLMATDEWLQRVDARHCFVQNQTRMLHEDAHARLLMLAQHVAMWQARHALATAAHDDRVEHLESRTQKLAASVARKALQCWLQRSSVSVFNRWKLFVKQRRHNADRMRSVLCLFNTYELQRTFGLWKQRHIRRQRHAALVARWQRLHALSLQKTVLGAWARTARDQRQLRHLLTKLGCSFQTSLHAAWFHTWRDFAAQRRRLRSRLQRLVASLAQPMQRSAFTAWLAAAEAQVQAAYRARLLAGEALLQATWRQVATLSWFRTWATSTRRWQHERQLLARCAGRLRHLAVGKTFATWADHVTARKNRRASVALIARLISRHQLVSLWCRWRANCRADADRERAAFHAQAQELRDALAVAHGNVDALRLQVHEAQRHRNELRCQLLVSVCARATAHCLRPLVAQWRRVAATRLAAKKRIERQLRRRRRQLTVRTWLTWVLETRRRQRKRHVILSVAAHAMRSALRLVLRAWRRCATERLRKHGLLQKAHRSRAHMTLGVFWRWWRSHQERQRQACTRLVECTTRLEATALATGFARWIHAVATIKAAKAARRQRLELLTTGRTRSHCQIRLDLWKHYAVARRTKRQANAEAHRFRLCRLWTRWCHVAAQRSLWRHFSEGCKRRWLRRGWQLWLAGVAWRAIVTTEAKCHLALEAARAKHAAFDGALLSQRAASAEQLATLESELSAKRQECAVLRAALEKRSNSKVLAVTLRQVVHRWHQRTATKVALRRVSWIVCRKGHRLLTFAWRAWLLGTAQRSLASLHASALDRERRNSTDASQQAVAAIARDTALWKRKWAARVCTAHLAAVARRLVLRGFQRWQRQQLHDRWQSELRQTTSALRASVIAADAAERQEAVAAAVAAGVRTREALVQPLQAIFRVLFRASSIEQLLDGVAVGLLPQAAGMLWLANPLNEELWSKAHDTVVAVPSHLGIAGKVCASGVVFRSVNVVQDHAFHAIVDQYVIERCPSGTASVHLVCVPVRAPDGPALGVVQLASAAFATDLFVLCHAVAFAVESILGDVLRHARDQAAAQARAALAKSFKQHKRWKHYYAAMQQRLAALQAEHATAQARNAALEADRAALHERVVLVERRHRDAKAEIDEHVEATQALLHDKVEAMRQALVAREDAITVLERELASKTDKLRRYKAAWQQARHQAAAAEDTMQRAADVANLRNELARALADARFLAKAIGHCLQHNGKLPRNMEAEVLRICAAQT
ncbi:hypothetical protein ACHHYP_07138 [Achlya hypogyna]|uniref:GAF domain-containing protein n=1 Tax=Achlya hypogyna TaxID=1202772 RepID=A0A1V9ZMT7_ACHHY|nr:hypothetical protein ACHHYP_07138 [Achlya hypogyna]